MGNKVRPLLGFLKATRPKTRVHRLLRRLQSDVLVEFDGWQLYCDPSSNYTGYFLALNDYPPEISTYREFKRIISGRKIDFYDIGANIGVFSVPAAEFAAAGSQITCFEPNDRVAKILTKNLQPYSKHIISVKNVAVGRDSGREYLHVPKARFPEFGKASIIAPSGNSIRKAVDVVSLFEVIPRPKSEFDLRVIKIDIEGYEDRALFEFIRDANRDALPDIIILEVAHKDLWKEDLLSAFSERNYQKTFEAEGNEVYMVGDSK